MSKTRCRRPGDHDTGDHDTGDQENTIRETTIRETTIREITSGLRIQDPGDHKGRPGDHAGDHVETMRATALDPGDHKGRPQRGDHERAGGGRES